MQFQILSFNEVSINVMQQLLFFCFIVAIGHYRYLLLHHSAVVIFFGFYQSWLPITWSGLISVILHATWPSPTFVQHALAALACLFSNTTSLSGNDGILCNNIFLKHYISMLSICIVTIVDGGILPTRPAWNLCSSTAIVLKLIMA